MKITQKLIPLILSFVVILNMFTIAVNAATGKTWTIDSFTEPLNYDQYKALREGTISVEKKDFDTGISCTFEYYYVFSYDGNKLYVNTEAFSGPVSNDFTTVINGLNETINSYNQAKFRSCVYKARVGISEIPYSTNDYNFHIQTYDTYIAYLKVFAEISNNEVVLTCQKHGNVQFSYTNKAIVYNKYENREPANEAEYFRALKRSISYQEISLMPTLCLNIKQPGDNKVSMHWAEVKGKGFLPKNKDVYSALTDCFEVVSVTKDLVGSVYSGNVLGMLNSFVKITKTYKLSCASERYESDSKIFLSDGNDVSLQEKFHSPIFIKNYLDCIEVTIRLSDSPSRNGTKTLFSTDFGIDCYKGETIVSSDNNGFGISYLTGTPQRYVRYAGQSSTLINSKNAGVEYRKPVYVEVKKDYKIEGPAPELEGYTFLGYSLNESSVTPEYQVGDIIKADKDITLYPIFKLSKPTMQVEDYDVSLDASSSSKNQAKLYVSARGTFSNGSKYSVTSDNKNIIATVSDEKYSSSNAYDCKSCNLTLTGKAGGKAWVSVSLLDENKKTIITQNIHVDVDESYPINYYADDALVKKQTKKYDENLILLDYIPEKTGFNFMGWSTSKGSTTAEYGPGDLYKENKALNLYPVWNEKYEIRWSIANNILTVSGKGDMASYPTGKTPWNDYKTTIKKIVVENGVTSIGSNAFDGFTALTEVSLPYGITKLGTKAFYNCTSLTKINFPTSIKSYGNKAFGNCTALKDANIPNVGGLLKSGVADSNVPVEIGAYAFENCVSLSSVAIPADVEKIGAGAYSGCTGIETLNISNGVTEIDDNAFYGCSSIESVSIPTSVDIIGAGTFSGCSNLNDLSVSEGVENIGDQAFSGCSALTSVSIPESAKDLGTGVFSACSNLADVNLPESLDYIGGAMFSGCSALESIDIPNNVSYVGDGAFRSCSSLEKVDLPKNVNVISNDTFYGCSSLKDVTVESTIYSVGDYAFANCSNLKKVIIDEGVSEIGVCSFAFCPSLETVSLPSSLTLIDDGAFMECSALSNVDMLEASLMIGEDVFSGCSNLENIQIPSSVISIGENAFADCELLTITCFSSSSVYDQLVDTYSRINTLVFAEGVTIPDESVIVPVDSEISLSASVQPINATDPSVTWRSDNEFVAVVDENGNVRAISGGTANIIVTTNDGLFSDVCEIFVDSPVKSFDFVSDELTVYVGDQFTPSYEFNPVSPSNKNIEWKSSDENIATVDITGVVSILNPGEVVITGKTEDGGFTDTCVLNCEKYVELTGISICDSLEIYTGKSQKIDVMCSPSNATEKYSSFVVKEGYEDIVSIDDSGNVIGLKPGEAYIYASNDDFKSNECKVTVVDNGSIGIMNMTKLNNTTVAYKSTITFYPEISNVTDIKWVVSGAEGIQNEDGSLTVKQATNDFSIYCTARGVDQTEIKSEVETVHVKHGFFDKLIAFFKGLFGLLPVLYQ